MRLTNAQIEALREHCRCRHAAALAWDRDYGSGPAVTVTDDDGERD